MRDILKITAGVIAAVLIADAAGFFIWILSGQFPADGYYIGTITAHVLRSIII